MDALLDQYYAMVQSYKPDEYVDFAQDNWNLCWYIVIGYAVFCFVGPKIMKSNTPYDLRLPLFFWNLALSLFSFLGFLNTFPELVRIILKGYKWSVCSHPPDGWGSGVSGFWVMLFIYSKVPELVDTLFIVLRKKPLIFLHWYHHITVLLYCWHSFATEAPSGLYFVTMNYGVHAIMYFYYAIQVYKWFKGFPAYLITLAQIAQMIVGTGVCLSCWYYVYYEKDCLGNRQNLIYGALMYASYLALFVHFALNRFVFKRKKE